MLCLIALLLVLLVWAANSGGSSGGTSATAPGGHTPATSITPGPTPSGSHISGRPGGRQTSGSADPSATTGGGTDTGATGGGSAGSGAGGASGGSGGAAGGSSGGELPAGSSLPDCTPSAVRLTLRSVQNDYEPGRKPKFELTAANSGGETCKLDFGPTSAVVSIADAGNHHVWSTGDCPADRGAHLLQVPAHSSTTYTIEWNRLNSSPNCGTPKGQQAAAGTYLAEARLGGFGAKQVSFLLKDS